jgi:hypothetical protein
MRRVDHLRVRRSSVPGKLSEQIFQTPRRVPLQLDHQEGVGREQRRRDLSYLPRIRERPRRDATIVKLDAGPQLRAALSGRTRTNRVRVVAGDRDLRRADALRPEPGAECVPVQVKLGLAVRPARRPAAGRGRVSLDSRLPDRASTCCQKTSAVDS